ncbi:MAG: copper transporter [Acidimicrobiales bacterium]
MINLRYHIVSIVAVFLALGIGIAMGTTFIDGFIVQRLENNLTELRADRVADGQEIDDLNAEINQNIEDQAQFDTEASGTIFSKRLKDVPVLVVADRGVDELVLEELQRALLTSSARYEGTLWIEERMDTSNDENRRQLAETLGLTEGSDAEAVERVLRSNIRIEFAVNGAADTGEYLARSGALLGQEILTLGGTADVESVAVATIEPRLLQVLDREDFVEWDTSGVNRQVRPFAPMFGTTVLLVSSPDSLPGVEAFQLPLLEELQRTSPVPAVVVDDGLPGDDEPAGLALQLRTGRRSSEGVATVEVLAGFDGISATILALDGIGVIEVGDWGKSGDLLPPPVREIN